ncbi:substrate-binding domain-containing protein [Salinispira pacifica]
MRRFVAVLAIFGLAAGMAIANGAKESSAKKPTIAGIVFQTDQFFRIVEIGMQAAAKQDNADLLLASSNNSAQTESQLVDTYVSRGVDAIAISPLSATASIDALKKANDKGVKIVTYNSPLNADFPVSYINSSQSQLGESTGKAAAAYIKAHNITGTVKVAVLAFDSQLPEISAARVNGFLNELKKAPGITVDVVARQDGYLADKAFQTAGNIITAHPDLNMFFAANEGGTVGATQAVKSANKAGKIVVFGTDATEQLAQFLLDPDNILQAVTGQQPYKIGFTAVDNAVKAIKGESVEKTVIVPGVLLSRDNPDAVKSFVADLKKMIK